MPANEQRIKNLKETIEQLQKMIEELEAQDKVESEKSVERWKPEDGGQYWFVDFDGELLSDRWQGADYDKGSYRIDNCFKTREEAEMHKLRLESMANRWRPEEGENFYYYSMETWASCRTQDYIHRLHFPYYWIGNCHKTLQDALKWYEKYGKAFGI